MSETDGSTKPFRIAIVGGAIGGLTTALFLDHFCRRPPLPLIAVDVYEQAGQYREIGAGVGLGLNAARLAHRVPGLGAAMDEIRGREDGSWFTFCRWDDGRVITHVDSPAAGGGDAVRPSSMARSEFLDVLLRLIRERRAATLHTSKKFARVEDLGDGLGVEISFADGTTAGADLLIGSDGIHSEVRRQFVAGRALYSGKIAYRGVVPIDRLPRDTWPGRSWPVIWMARHKHFLVYPISRSRSLNIVAFVSKREDEIPDLRESWAGTCDRRELEADFGDCDETVRAVIRLMPERPSKWRINDHEPVPQWVFLGGRVVLLGDACHATTPHQGAGAGQAVEDGYVLSRALSGWLEGATRAPLGAWMALYQRVRLPRAQKVVTTSREAGELYEFESPDLVHLPYDEAVPIVAERLQERLKWLWMEDLDAAYEREKKEAGL